ncbi:MAG: hypothetical protein M5R38_00245 [Candidatus Methylomirabilis sp.]|nr:hypothetical protein [Candidatus Methylomirabilis sp.]
MKVEIRAQDLLSYAGDALIVNLFEGVGQPGGATGAVDRALGGSIAAAIQRKEFKGKLHERLLLHTTGQLPVARVLVIGLGKSEELTLERVRSASAEAMRHLRGAGAQMVGSIVHGAGIGGWQPIRRPARSPRAHCWVSIGLINIKSWKRTGRR